MRQISWLTFFGILLIVLSAGLYLVHYILFHDLYHIAIYGLGDLAFLPIEVLLVVLIVDRVIANREKQALLQKLNMEVGLFFNEVGTMLLRMMSDVDPHVEEVRSLLAVTTRWTHQNFLEASAELKNYKPRIVLSSDDASSLSLLEELLTLLASKTDLLVGILGNPSLLEQETFTDLLWAVSHLADELSLRGDLRHLPTPDYAHLAVDINRAYGALIREWLRYMEHLMRRYPYLFSLALRMNPFDPNARPEITQ